MENTRTEKDHQTLLTPSLKLQMSNLMRRTNDRKKSAHKSICKSATVHNSRPFRFLKNPSPAEVLGWDLLNEQTRLKSPSHHQNEVIMALFHGSSFHHRTVMRQKEMHYFLNRACSSVI